MCLPEAMANSWDEQEISKNIWGKSGGFEIFEHILRNLEAHVHAYCFSHIYSFMYTFFSELHGLKARALYTLGKHCHWTIFQPVHMLRKNKTKRSPLANFWAFGNHKLVGNRKRKEKKRKLNITQLWTLWTTIMAGLVRHCPLVQQWSKCCGSNQPLSGHMFMGHSTKRNLYLKPLSGQESIARDIIDPSRESTTIILSNEHGIKPMPNDIIPIH